MKIRPIIITVALLAVMNLYGCGGGGGGGTSTTPAGSVSISGVAAMGLINGGDVKVYAVKDGKVDTTAALGSATTASDGSYAMILPLAPTGPVVLEVTGGTFTDEASGTSGVNNKVKLRAAVSSVADGAKIAVTTLTLLACSQVEGIGNFSAIEIDDANLQIGRFFEVSNIIGSLPFDPTLPAPAGASNDQRTHSTALAVISFLVNNRKGSLPLEDAMVTVHTDLENELKNNGGFSLATITDVNTAISSYANSGKNKGGLPIKPVSFSGGVLQLSTAGTLPEGTLINGIDCTVTLPAGVTVKTDPMTGAARSGVVAPVTQAATNTSVSAKFDTATGVLRIILINVQPGFAIGEFAHVEFLGFPVDGKGFELKVNRIDGGSGTTSGPLTGISLTSNFAGL
jgi:hypothetical protein